MTTYCAMCPDWEIKNPHRCSNTLEDKGRTVYFCTARCKERFLRSAETAKAAPKKRRA